MLSSWNQSVFSALPGPENVYLSGCCSGNAPEHSASSLTAASRETLGWNLKGGQKRLLLHWKPANMVTERWVGACGRAPTSTAADRRAEAEIWSGGGWSRWDWARPAELLPWYRCWSRTVETLMATAGPQDVSTPPLQQGQLFQISHQSHQKYCFPWDEVLLQDGKMFILTSAVSFFLYLRVQKWGFLLEQKWADKEVGRIK